MSRKTALKYMRIEKLMRLQQPCCGLLAPEQIVQLRLNASSLNFNEMLHNRENRERTNFVLPLYLTGIELLGCRFLPI